MDKYRKSRIQYIGFVAAALLATLFIIDYATREINRAPTRQPVTDSLITATYPELYSVIYSRSAPGLQPFLEHESEAVRTQAWRALAAAPVDSLDWLIQETKDANAEHAWFALSMHSLTGDQLRGLEQHWRKTSDHRAGINRVLGRQGDEQTLRFLLGRLEEAGGSPYEYSFALALGRLMTRFELESLEQRAVVRQAFQSTNSSVTRSYLYGFYQDSAQKLNTEESDSLYQQWKLYGLGNSTNVDQYIAKILKQRVFYELTLYYNSEELLDRRVQLGVELARVLGELEITPDIALAAKILAMHPNPFVVQQTLASLKGKLKEEDHLFSYITQDILEDGQIEEVVWLQALETAASVDSGLIDEHAEKLDQIQENHPYLLPRVFAVREIGRTPQEYLNLLESAVGEGDRLQTQLALKVLGDYWIHLPEKVKNPQLAGNTRALVFEALSQRDRGVAYMARDLLMQENLFNPGDFEQINRVLLSFDLPEDIEVFQAFGSLYKERFEEQARPVIDSLAALQYAPLNYSLSQAGWDVAVPEDITQSFRMPDWDQLWKLGREPVWVLATEKGTIRVQVEVLSAPAAISALDSLTRAGAYDGVPFHRVVPNFVIQGGDVERQDGFGTPDFVIPTEPQEEEFTRGAAGLASAGKDTEGSQYFFMHQWSPHLNGRYTLFGQVIDGMDVVDQVVVGDRVERVYWE